MKSDAKTFEAEDEWMSTVALAKATHSSRSYWDKARIRGDGPPYVLIGNRPRYKRADIVAWLTARSINSTSARAN